MLNENIKDGVHHCSVHPYKKVCWSAIFAGALVGVGLGFLLNLFGIAIGLTTFTLDPNGAQVLAIGGFIGFIISVIASMVAAGYTAGFLGRSYAPRRNLGLVYGFTTWSVSLILSAILATHVSHYVVTYTNSIAPAVAVVSDNAPNADSVAVQPNQNTTTTNNNDNTQKAMQVNASPSGLALSAFIVFALFFVGAISACFGAHWAMHCCRDDD